MNNLERVREFHEKFSAAVDSEITENLVELRMKLIYEEVNETDVEFDKGIIKGETDPSGAFSEYFWMPSLIDRKKLTKELADILYVVYGTAVTFGLPLQEVFEAVHESNMSKLGEDGKPIYREDGKVLKGPNYKEPDLEKYFNES